MENVETFLVHAIRLEYDAARQCEDLAEAMGMHGNTECQKLFGTMAKFARMHLADAQARGGFRELPDFATFKFNWPDGDSPEMMEAWVDTPMLSTTDALEACLVSERRSLDFYSHVLETTDDPEIKALAKDFVGEEAEHCDILERWLAGDRVQPEAA